MTAFRQPERTPNVVTGEPVHVVTPPPQDDETAQHIAEILTTAASAVAAAALIAALIHVSKKAALMAITMTRGSRSTADRPNARHAPHGNENRGAAAEFAKSYAAIDLYYRAAYVANAAQRIQAGLDAGKPVGEIISAELPNYDRHEQARRQRLDAAGRVAKAVAENGNLLGWYLDPELNNEIECIRANGNNFYANRPPVIGLPGMVHPKCGCVPGPPHFGAGMVDDAVADVVRLESAPTRRVG